MLFERTPTKRVPICSREENEKKKEMNPAPKLRTASRIATSLAALALFTAPAFAGDPPTNEELYEMVKAQQEQIDATADAVEEAGSGQGGGWFEKTSLGAYGELHFNWLEGSDGADNKSQVDFHRFVLFVNHEFSDKIRFYSELELEHALAGDGAPGEVELEQAYIQFDLPHQSTANAGLFLVPVGILNETHEPPTFYGVERNPIESKIIPSTWWEGGGMVTKRFDHGISADLAVHSPLQTDDFTIRAGRRKVAEAVASDVAVTGRVVYRGQPGLEIGATVQWQEDIAEKALDNTSAILFETHVVYERGPFGLRALYARWDLDSDGAEDIGADEQYGFYVEPSYKFCECAGVFVRYNQWNNTAGNSGGTMRQYDVGFNFWPHEQVVLKVDGQFQRNDNGAPELDGVNLGVGFNF